MLRIALFPLLVAALAGSSAAATSPTARPCPSLAIVDKALGQHDKAPVSTRTPYSKTCTYAGASRILSTKITLI